MNQSADAVIVVVVADNRERDGLEHTERVEVERESVCVCEKQRQ